MSNNTDGVAVVIYLPKLKRAEDSQKVPTDISVPFCRERMRR